MYRDTFKIHVQAYLILRAHKTITTSQRTQLSNHIQQKHEETITTSKNTEPRGPRQTSKRFLCFGLLDFVVFFCYVSVDCDLKVLVFGFCNGFCIICLRPGLSQLRLTCSSCGLAGSRKKTSRNKDTQVRIHQPTHTHTHCFERFGNALSVYRMSE